MGARAVQVALPVAALLAGLTACTPDAYPYVEVRPTQPPAQATGARCPRDGSGLIDVSAGATPGTLPAGFTPTRVRQCRLDLAPTASGDGRLRYTVAEITSPVTADLLAALTLPDQQFDPRDEGACAAVYTAPTFVLLIDADDRAYRPHLPLEPCQQPRSEVSTALTQLVQTQRTTYTVEVPT